MTGALLTVDEARVEVIASAITSIEGARCSPDALVALLLGQAGDHDGWTDDDRRLAARHRGVLRAVADAGHGWVVAPELDGILAATGLRDGQLRDVDVIHAQLPGRI